MDLCPNEGAGHVNRGVLPNLALGPAQSPDVEAVDLDQVTRLLYFEMERHRSRRWLTFWGSGVAGDEGEAPGLVPKPCR